MSESNVELLLSRFNGTKQTGLNKWIVPCPAHDDRSPSLGIKLTDEGTILINCFAGCDKQTILDSIGLTFNDLFPPKTAKDYDPTKPKTKAPKFSKSELFDLLVIEALILAQAYQSALKGDTISEIDQNRVAQAFNTVLRLQAEVYA